MKRFLCLLCLLWGVGQALQSQTRIDDFRLTNVDGRTVSLSSFPGAQGFVVVFTCNHCPFARLYTQRLNDLNRRYQKRGIYVLAINSMDTLVYEDETLENMRLKAQAENFAFPYLQDAGQSVGRQFGAKHTPQAFVIWKDAGVWTVRYSGAIDSNGAEPQKAIPYVAQALDALIAGKPVATPQTKSFGCAIYYR